VILSQSKTVDACASCHTMVPFVADMKDPKSETLAALHYKNRYIPENQCYTCHTGYGLAGNVNAKMGGIRHVLHYYLTGVPKEIRIRHPFPVATCLHCHGEAASFLNVEQHVDVELGPKIRSGELSCFECHEAPHPPSLAGGGRKADATPKLHGSEGGPPDAETSSGVTSPRAKR
jgi:nitrate/TMAO reductase-like tetraheme cytochrome c subunit